MSKRKIINKLKYISAALSLIAMTTNEVKAITSYSLEKYEDIKIEIDEETENTKYINTYLNELPTYLLNFINRKDINIVLLNGQTKAEEKYNSIYEESLNSSISGFCDYKNKTIYLESQANNEYYEKYSNSSHGLSKDEFNKKVF